MQGQQDGEPEVRLAEVIAALSLAIDLNVGQSMEHALRSAVLAVRLGGALGLSESELVDAYYLALLRHVGCTAEARVAAAVFQDEIAARTWFTPVVNGRRTEVFAAIVQHLGRDHPPLARARRLIATFASLPQLLQAVQAECEVAQRLAERWGFGEGVQCALAQALERWDGGGMPNHLKGEAIALPMRVVQLALDAELFFRLGGVEAVVAMARRRAGGAHDPTIVERFCREAPGLLVGLDRESAWDMALAAEPGPRPRLSAAQLDATARAIADFVSLQSPYLAGHSNGVAELAAGAARGLGLPEADAVTLRRAGWLHDLGRVAVSAGIWAKPGPLSDGEWERVRLHPYYTERILARPKVLAPFGALAAMHHERLDGSGYYRRLAAPALPLLARVLASADVYQALTEPRPHRPARAAGEAADELRREVRAGRLDAEATNAVLAAAGHRVRSRRRGWPAGLTEREVEVLRLVTRGLGNREMARRLGLSERTVHHHIQHIYDKLGVSTRAAATLSAMQHDLLEITG
ncbi:MAG TPA: HD domain-containing phosphohydrolase [Chloroflexota bacterium]